MAARQVPFQMSVDCVFKIKILSFYWDLGILYGIAFKSRHLGVDWITSEDDVPFRLGMWDKGSLFGR